MICDIQIMEFVWLVPCEYDFTCVAVAYQEAITFDTSLLPMPYQCTAA
jgi:hypothetical protein